MVESSNGFAERSHPFAFEWRDNHYCEYEYDHEHKDMVEQEIMDDSKMSGVPSFLRWFASSVTRVALSFRSLPFGGCLYAF